jgi:quercetin dioxygenase-like cupin family protein
MNVIKKMIIGALVSCTAFVIYACNVDGTDAEVQSVELLCTSQSWNDVDLPDYPQGQPELVAVKYVIPPGKKLGWHHHVAMNHGVLVQGELTINAQDGKTKVMRAGEVVVEMVDAIHHGENRGTEPVVLYMFYLSQKDMTLTVQHPEIPLE